MAYFIRRADGRAHSLFGWTPDVHSALHYRTADDAKAEMKGATFDGCTAEKVPPKLGAGMSRPERPIFSGGVNG